MKKTTPILKMTGAFLSGLALCLWLLPAQAFAGTGRHRGPDPMAKSETENARAYQAQAAFIRSEIEAVRQNLKWLELKIRDMKDMGRFVPERLDESVRFKKKKIKSLKALLKRYEQLGTPPSAKSVSTKGKKPAKGKKTAKGDKPVKELARQLASAGLADWIAMVDGKTGITLENRLPILFSSASARVAKGYAPFLRKLAAFLKNKDVRITVRGYADTDPIRTEQFPSNFELGAARASAVVRKLTAYGVKPSVFRVISTGEHRLDAAGKTRQWKNLQRHVNIQIRLL